MRNPISRNPISYSLVCSLILILCLFSTTSVKDAMGKDEVATIQKLTGKVRDSSLLSKRPPNGVVTDQASWNSLWTAWRANKEIQAVDFQTQIVLVATADGPSIVLTSSLNLTPSGDLRYEVASTKSVGIGFGYTLLVVPRNGILSVNGKMIPAAPAVAQPAVAKPTVAKPILVPPMNKAPQPKKAKLNAVDESIRVEIQGRVKTGFMSRAKSTGTMVVANGIVWELDLRNDPQLISAAKALALGTDVGKINGMLSKIENPDRTYRWVVDVESLGPVRSSNRDAEMVQSEPPQSMLPSNKMAIAPMATPSSKPAAIQPLQPTEVPKTIPMSQQMGFKSIVVSATGGRSKLERKQTVAADGSVTLEVPKTNYSESFSLDADSLQKLHVFVANADWRSVPHKTGPVGQDNTNFSISVATKNGTKRFFIDGGSIRSQPIISRLFALMKKPPAQQ